MTDGCQIGPGQQAKTRDLYASYERWQSQNADGKPLSARQFGRSLSGRPGLAPAWVDRRRGWSGISLCPNSGSASSGLVTASFPETLPSSSYVETFPKRENNEANEADDARANVIPAEKWQCWRTVRDLYDDMRDISDAMAMMAI